MSNSDNRAVAAKNNVLWFAAYYLPEHIKGTIPDLHKEWYSLANTYDRIALAAPRGHAKSTSFSLVYVLWCILTKRKKFIVMLSDTASQAAELLGGVVQELETNERIIEDFGKIAGYVPTTAEEKTKWTTKDIVTTTGIKVIAAGWKAKLRGLRHGPHRPDLVILDDVENDESVESDVQRAKVKNVFYSSIMNLGDVNTQFIVIGTILHSDALLTTILDNPPARWHTHLYKAIENDKPLWPEVWTLERLEEKREEVGSVVFEKEYMNNPINSETQILKPSAYYEQIDLALLDCYGYVDLAISEKEQADYTAIVTVGVHRQTKDVYVVNASRIKASITSQMEMVFDKQKLYNYRKIGVEDVAYQKAFYQLLKVESAKRSVNLPVVPVQIDKDKVRRALEITPYVENGRIKFNASFQDFMSEVLHFPRGLHDDYVDAFVGAVKLALAGSTAVAVSSGGGINYPKNL